jgi:hypothetical protein
MSRDDQELVDAARKLASMLEKGDPAAILLLALAARVRGA